MSSTSSLAFLAAATIFAQPSALLDRDIVQPLCVFSTLEASKGVELCRTPLIEAVCGAKGTLYSERLRNLASDPAVAQVMRERGNELLATLDQEFRISIDRCINHHDFEVSEEDRRRAEDPVFQKRLQEGRSRFWHLVFRDVGRLVSRGAINVVAGTTLAHGMSRFMFSGMCYGGLHYYASLPEHDPRHHSCARSGASLCGIYGGFVNLHEWPGFQTDNEVVKTIQDIASLGLEATCRTTGKSLFCGIYQQSLEQISMAIKTGNNDWAECLGISAAARSLGEASVGWSDHSGIAQAVAQPVSLQGKTATYWTKDCCVCWNDRYESLGGWLDYFFTDRHLERRPELSVIQSSSDQSCQRREGYRQIEENHYTYRRYCRRTHILGKSCTLEEPRYLFNKEFVVYGILDEKKGFRKL